MAEGFDKFLAIPTSQKVALFVVVMGAIAAGWYFLYFEETQSAIAAELNRAPQLIKDRDAEKTILKDLDARQQEIEKLRKERNDMRDRLPDSAEIADLLEKIHSQANIVGLQIERFERTDEEADQLYARIPVQMRLKGTFQEVSTFFYYLGRLTRIVNVENIQLTMPRTQGKDQEPNDTLVATCTATTFRYLAQAETPAPAAETKKGKKGKK